MERLAEIGQCLQGIPCEGLSLEEYLLCAKTYIAPWQRATLESFPSESPQGMVLLAALYSHLSSAFQNFDVLVSGALERFVEVREKEDLIYLLDSLLMLPFFLESIYGNICASVDEIINEIACLSSGTAGMLEVCRESVERLIVKNFEGLTIHARVHQFTTALVKKKCAESRLGSLFDLISIYPDSEPAVDELATIIDSVSMERRLDLVMENCKKRLLLPSIPTETIIGQFVHGLPVFKALDSTGLLLDRTSLLAKEYIEGARRREVPKVVYMIFCLLCDGALEPKRKIKFDVQGEEHYDYLDSSTWDSWLPDPPATGDAPIRLSSRSFDPLTVLVNFSSEEELFNCFHESTMSWIISGSLPFSKVVRRINTAANFLFQKSLCTRLLVMIQDVRDSQDMFGKNPEYHLLAISHKYWPLSSLEDGGGCFVDTLTAGFPNLPVFSAKFSEVKPNRKLVFIPELSSIDMDLIVEEVAFSLNSVPYNSFRVLQKFLSAAHNTVVSNEMNKDDISGLAFLSERGFIRLDGANTIRLVKPSGLKTIDFPVFKSYVSDRTIPDGEFTKDEPRPDMPPHIAPMITAMLTNLGPMPASRIHTMLSTMSGLKEPVEALQSWLQSRDDLKLDPITGLYSRQLAR